MIAIYKYPLGQLKDEISIEMPIDAVILSLKTQNGSPCFWASVDTAAEMETRRFKIVGTGHSITGFLGKFIDTFLFCNDKLVFHVFEMAK